MKSFIVGVAVIVGLLSSHAAFAEPIVITSGSTSFFWPGDRGGYAFVGDGTYLFGDGFGGWGVGIDVMTNIATVYAGFAISDPLTRNVTVNGIAYTNVIVGGSAGFFGQPFVLPPAVLGDDRVFVTPFTMTGHVVGRNAFDQRAPELFAADVTGVGQLTFSGRVSGDQPQWNFAARPAGAAFEAPSATPEPATWLMISTALLVGGYRYRSKMRSLP